MEMPMMPISINPKTIQKWVINHKVQDAIEKSAEKKALKKEGIAIAISKKDSNAVLPIDNISIIYLLIAWRRGGRVRALYRTWPEQGKLKYF